MKNIKIVMILLGTVVLFNLHPETANAAPLPSGREDYGKVYFKMPSPGPDLPKPHEPIILPDESEPRDSSTSDKNKKGPSKPRL